MGVQFMTSAQKTIIYARVSTSHHDQRPEIQINELRRFCAARGWEIAHEITDHGYSGSSDTRPGFKKLLQLVRSREVDAVVVVKLDRLFRGLKHLVSTLEEFQSLGIAFVATKDSVDYTTPSGRLFVQILGSLAEFEKSLLRERTMMGLEHARSLGKKLGRPKKTNDNAIVTLSKQGLSQRAIQKKLRVSKGAIWRALGSAPKTPSWIQPPSATFLRRYFLNSSISSALK
jgi:DNA invertase Pin-like site-specific DNA recombinase